MDTKKVRLGSISILMSVILLCVAVLAVLSVTSARADDVMARRYASWTSAYYELQNEGQAYYQSLDEAVLSGQDPEAILLESGAVPDENGVYVKVIARDEMTLTIHMELADGNIRVLGAETDTNWEEDTSMNLLP